VPFILTEEELRTMHGDNERVSTENLERGVRVLYRALITLAAAQ
jgi:acetylornithine deacetylase/succinyl-diaminopimelate desuccinylase-like protein